LLNYRYWRSFSSLKIFVVAVGALLSLSLSSSTSTAATDKAKPADSPASEEICTNLLNESAVSGRSSVSKLPQQTSTDEGNEDNKGNDDKGIGNKAQALSGNVRGETVSSPHHGGKDPGYTEGSNRVIRGGSWYGNASNLRSAAQGQPILGLKRSNPVSTEAQREHDFAESWEKTRKGLTALNSSLYEMENMLLYAASAILAKENIMLDGPGGGAKTFAIRKLMESQLAAIRERATDEEKAAWLRDIQVFVKQCNQAMSERDFVGGPDPFKLIEEGDYEIDYSRALIAPHNLFGLIDEIDKMPVSIQMTLLSILNERQALIGNRVVQTMLQAVAATTNMTQGEFIAQAPPSEVGGRMAMVDRFAVKIHVVNVTPSARDLYLLIETVNSSGDKQLHLIDLAAIRPLLEKVQIPDDMLLGSALEIGLHMDRVYTAKLNKAIEEAQGTNSPPKYYPPFSGSTRTHTKVVPLWKSAFLVRQLLDGVPYSKLRLTMHPADLPLLAVPLLQGGVESFVNEHALPVAFILHTHLVNDSSAKKPRAAADINSNKLSLFEDDDEVSGSDSNKRASENPYIKNRVSLGVFDPHNLTFSYKNRKGQSRKVIFDPDKGSVLYPNEEVRLELEASDHPMVLARRSTAKAKYFVNLNEILKRKYENFLIRQKKALSERRSQPRFVGSGRTKEFLDKAALRQGEREQLKDLEEFQQEFLSAVNSEIEKLSDPKTYNFDLKKLEALLLETEKQNSDLANELRAKMAAAFENGSSRELKLMALESLRLFYNELKSQFLDSELELQAILTTVAVTSGKNIALYGGPGSAKTLKSRLIISAALDTLSEAQIATINEELVSLLVKAGLSEKGHAYIKQFHPMSTEGEVVGRPDLGAMRRGEGYKYKFDGTLAAKDVFFVLLDEFEKAPPGVRTALLSLLNEREVLSGDELVKSNVRAFLIATNATPSNFLIGLGEFSTAWPIWDRIQRKAYAFNKLKLSDLRDIYLKAYLGRSAKLNMPLFFVPIKEMLTTKIDNETSFFSFSEDDPGIDEMLVQIQFRLNKIFVDESEVLRATHMDNPEAAPDYFVASRGESNRSALSILSQGGELSAAVFAKRIFDGDSLEEIVDSGIVFKMSDIVAFLNLFMTANPFYQLKYSVKSDGFPEVSVEASDHSELLDRMPLFDIRTLEYLKKEADIIAQVATSVLQRFIKNRLQLILENPNIFPSLFTSEQERVNWLLAAGVNKEDVKRHYPNANID